MTPPDPNRLLEDGRVLCRQCIDDEVRERGDLSVPVAHDVDAPCIYCDDAGYNEWLENPPDPQTARTAPCPYCNPDDRCA